MHGDSVTFQNVDVLFGVLGFEVVVAELACGDEGAVVEGWKYVDSPGANAQVRHVEKCSVCGLNDSAVWLL